MKPDLRKTFDWLKAQGLPPLPIAPAQDPQQYPAKERDGTLKRNQSGALIAAFTGKNPSFLDVNGIPHLIRHTRYQHQLPTEQELRTWFAHPANGIGTLGGWQNLVWLDVDVKQFDSRDACNARVSQWLSQYPLLQQTFTERTHSGGWRFAVRVPEKRFTNFSLEGAGCQHMGEALGQGRFTVLAPTIGPSGQPYVNLQRVSPVWVDRLEAIGVYPVSRRRGRPELTRPRPPIQVHPAQPGGLRLEDLATAKAQAVLQGESPLESRSHSLTYALREFYGWENWAADNGVPISGNAEDLARVAGMALGIGSDRVERIIQSLPDPANCLPAVVFVGGEADAWRRVWQLDRETYDRYCPNIVKKDIQSRTRERFRQIQKQVHRVTMSQIQRPENSHNPSEGAQTNDKKLSFDQQQELVQHARRVLDQMGQIESREDQTTVKSIRRWFQGQIYRLEAEDQRLVVEARGRGVILQADEAHILYAKLTSADLQQFRLATFQLHRNPGLARGISARAYLLEHEAEI